MVGCAPGCRARPCSARTTRLVASQRVEGGRGATNNVSAACLFMASTLDEKDACARREYHHEGARSGTPRLPIIPPASAIAGWSTFAGMTWRGARQSRAFVAWPFKTVTAASNPEISSFPRSLRDAPERPRHLLRSVQRFIEHGIIGLALGAAAVEGMRVWRVRAARRAARRLRPGWDWR